jgi:hypothetical protein
MKKMNQVWMVAAMVGCWAMAPMDAQARQPQSQCEANADCPSGYTCEIIGASTCAVPEPGEGGMEPNCDDSFQYSICVPPPPAQCDPSLLSADCDGNLVCVTYTYEECSGGGFVGCVCASNDPDCDCPEPPPGRPGGDVSCQTTSQSYCVPPYLAPCEVSSDCGVGFTCEAREVCTATCSGSDPSPGRPGMGDEPAPGCEVTCENSDAKYCKLVEQECSADSDCFSGFSCVSNLLPPVSGDCAVSSDGDDECDDTPAPSESKSYCLPDGWERWGGSPGGGIDYESAVSHDGSGPVRDAQPARNRTESPINLGDDTGGAEASGCQVGGLGLGASGSGAGLLAILLSTIGWRRRRA